MKEAAAHGTMPQSASRGVDNASRGVEVRVSEGSCGSRYHATKFSSRTVALHIHGRSVRKKKKHQNKKAKKRKENRSKSTKTQTTLLPGVVDVIEDHLDLVA